VCFTLITKGNDKGLSKNQVLKHDKRVNDMKVQTSRSTLFAMLLGLTSGPAIAATDVNATELGPILEEAINDYDSSTDTYTEFSKGSDLSVFPAILDESSHDYNRSEARAFNQDVGVGQLEQGEFAAFERSTNFPEEIGGETDW
jgi:hypothetical protein